jgi:hypothetical protein
VIPYGHHEIREFDGKSAGQMNSVGSSQRVCTRQLPSVTLDGSGEFHWLNRRPKSLPIPQNLPRRASINTVISYGSGECGPNLWVRKTARERTIASIPKSGREVATFFVNDELHQRAGVEVDERHSYLTALLSDQIGYRRSGGNSSMISRFRSRRTVNSTDDTFSREPFQ